MPQNADGLLESLLESHKGFVYKIARSYTKTQEAREDLYQDIMFNICRSFSSFKGDSKISTWIYRVALYTAITNYRRELKSKTTNLDLELIDNHASSSDDDAAARESLLYDAVDRLSSINKAIILLLLEGKNHVEIGEVMGLRPTAVAMRVKRSKEKLAELLKNLTF